MTEALASKQPARFGFRMWRKLDADLIKQERIVMVRGKIQTRASVEPSAVLNAEDLQGITPSQSDTKAVYLERIQTVRILFSPSRLPRYQSFLMCEF